MPIVPPDDVYLNLAPILEEFRHLLKMFNFTAYEQFLDFTRSFSDKSPSLIARSLLFVIFIPSNRKILGKLMMANVIESSICSYLKLDLSKEFRSNRNVQFWTSTYGCSIFCNLIQDYCFNKARQRERIEFELETIGRLIDEVDRAVNDPDIKVPLYKNKPTVIIILDSDYHRRANLSELDRPSSIAYHGGLSDARIQPRLVCKLRTRIHQLLPRRCDLSIHFALSIQLSITQPKYTKR